MITGCGDGVVRCFDAKSGHLLRTFSGHDGAIMAIQTSGEKIFTATTDGTIRAFKIDWEFVKQYLQVLSGEVDDELGEDYVEETEVDQVPSETVPDVIEEEGEQE